LRIILSRKGFDSSYGGAPSPIVNGRPLSLPIPGSNGERTTYGALGLGRTVSRVTNRRLTGRHRCHDDPMFADGHCWLGQAGAAQGHLRKQGVRTGDHFLFFGLFADPECGERHHRIFGHMRIACHGGPAEVATHRDWHEPPRPHPHRAGQWGNGNTIYHGPGATAHQASRALRLTREGGPLCHWTVPDWLEERGLSYHANPKRWLAPGLLNAAKRGQEFVCDIGDDVHAHDWLAGIIAEIGA
jgi:hypothetical protein